MKNYPCFIKLLLLIGLFSSITGTTVLIDNKTDFTLHVSQKDWSGVYVHVIPAHKEHAIESLSRIVCNIVKVIPAKSLQAPLEGVNLLPLITITEVFPKGAPSGVIKTGSAGFGAPLGWWAKFIVEFAPA